MSEFKEFPKLFRLNRNWVASEKIDGTCACVVVSDDGVVSAQSRTRIITPEDDNAGFAKWCRSNRDELLKLGPGYHFGEFWGQGIARRYGLSEKRFSLFNTARWTDDVRPSCCHVVPVLATGTDVKDVEQRALTILREQGSIAARGFDRPEGIVLFHEPSQHMYKVTIPDDGHKGKC